MMNEDIKNHLLYIDQMTNEDLWDDARKFTDDAFGAITNTKFVRDMLKYIPTNLTKTLSTVGEKYFAPLVRFCFLIQAGKYGYKAYNSYKAGDYQTAMIEALLALGYTIPATATLTMIAEVVYQVMVSSDEKPTFSDEQLAQYAEQLQHEYPNDPHTIEYMKLYNKRKGQQ